PLAVEQWQRRGVVPQWLEDLQQSRRAITVRIADEERIAAIEDAGRLRDALGTALPVGIPESFLEPGADPLAELIARYARTHGPFTPIEVAEHFGIGRASAAATLARLATAGRLVSGEFRPGGIGTEWCDVEVLRRIRRRSVAALRQEIEPVPAQTLGLFSPHWNRITRPSRGTDGVLRSIEQLAGAAIPASSLETFVLPSRVSDYHPAMLDELTSAGEVLWCGRGRLASGDGWITLAPAHAGELLLPEPGPISEDQTTENAVLAVLAGGGAWLFRELQQRIDPDNGTSLLEAIWDLVWSAQITADTIAPLRALVAAGGISTRDHGRVGTRSAPRRPAGTGPGARTRAARTARGSTGAGIGPATAIGRWTAIPPREPDTTRRAAAMAQALLERHGVVTRGAVAAEQLPGGFAATYRVLSAAEDAGRTRRGYFVEGLGAAQFATPGAVDQLRLQARAITEPDQDHTQAAIVLAACDPANPYGAALPWPRADGAESIGHRPGRKAGAAVTLVEGALTLYLERGGKSLLVFSDDQQTLRQGAMALKNAINAGRLAPLKLQRANGAPIANTPIADALCEVGFSLTPSGLRLRP
ncbi:MAG: DEAD/DEAH box helicase, partial [Actinomycetes bacterium]